MRYEVREETKDGLVQWVIWDNLNQELVARFGNPDVPKSIIIKYQAAQMAAESDTE
jgi:hypothetical protein